MLTDVKLRALLAEPPKTRIELPDGSIPGLFLRVGPNRHPTWTFRFVVKGAGGTTNRGTKLAGRKFHRLNLGLYPYLTLKEARAKAAMLAADAAQGINPALEIQELASANNTSTYTIDMLADAFWETHVQTRLRSERSAKWVFKDFIRPKWGHRAPEGITKHEVIKELDRLIIKESKSAAIETRKWMSSMLNWAVNTGRIEFNPLIGIKAPTKFTPRERVLSMAEARAVWAVAGEMGYPSGTLVQLLMLTACRLREIANLQASWLDLSNACISVPGKSYKTGDLTVIALVPRALDIISNMPKHDDGEYLISSTNGYCPLYTVTPAALKRLKEDSQKRLGRTMEHWTLHDLRRSVATHMARLGVDEILIERVLGHHIGGVRAVYNRYRYLEEKRAALSLWTLELLPSSGPDGGTRYEPANDDLPAPPKNVTPSLAAGSSST
jgi:integrase